MKFFGIGHCYFQRRHRGCDNAYFGKFLVADFEFPLAQIVGTLPLGFLHLVAAHFHSVIAHGERYNLGHCAIDVFLGLPAVLRCYGDQERRQIHTRTADFGSGGVHIHTHRRKRKLSQSCHRLRLPFLRTGNGAQRQERGGYRYAYSGIHTAVV